MLKCKNIRWIVLYFPGFCDHVKMLNLDLTIDFYIYMVM